MSVWDEAAHDRDTRGKWTEMAGSAPEAGLQAAECPRHGAPLGPDGICRACVRDEQARMWGTTGVREGSRTPWGSADNVSDVAPGITEAGTPSHGGVKLSPARNAMVPAGLRRTSGWYEEDCEWNIAAATFPDEFVAHRGQAEGVFASREALLAETRRNIVDYFPDGWERATGERIGHGVSRVRDENVWEADHAGDWQVTGTHESQTRPGFVVATARKPGTREEAEFLMPAGDAREREVFGRFKAYRALVDPARHPRLPEKPAPARAHPARHHDAPDYGPASNLTLSARQRIARDMGQRWRWRDGRALTLRQIITEKGVTGKDATLQGGKRVYSLVQSDAESGDAYVFRVSKATFDAMPGVPDRRSPARIASQDAEVAMARAMRWDSPVSAVGRAALMRDTAARLAKAEAKARRATWLEGEAAREASQEAREREAALPER